MKKLPLKLALSALLAPSLAAQSLQTTLEAVQPLTLSYAGVPQQQHPAGPLTSASLVLNDPTCSSTGNLSCNLANNTLSASQDAWGSNCGYVAAASDLRLSVSAAQPGWATLRINIGAGGDCSSSVSIDVGDDGSNEIYYSFGTTFYKVRNLVIPVGPTPQMVRIHQNTCGSQPSGQSLTLIAESWSATSSQAQVGCGGLFGSPGWQEAECDHSLMFLGNAVPNELGVLRAAGHGQFQSFLVATTSPTLPLQLPAPFAQTCPTLSNVLALAPGMHAGQFGVQDLWTLPVPMLPPGLTFFVQHACAAFHQPPQAWAATRFDTSNIVRIDT